MLVNYTYILDNDIILTRQGAQEGVLGFIVRKAVG